MRIEQALVVENSKTNQAISKSLLDELEITSEIAGSEYEAWKIVEQSEQPFDLVVVARSALGPTMELFVVRLRANPDYSSVPLILLINDKNDDKEIEFLYTTGFTQVFSRKEYVLLRDYITQARQRDTFERFRQNKVLILEDNLYQQLLVKSILEEKFCECFCFTTAEEAIAEKDNLRPHVIVTDFFLGGKMTAMDLILQIKQDGHPWEHIPILVMTGLDDPTRKYELVRSGANDYIAKPIDALDLSVRVENLIRYKHLLDRVEQQKMEMQHLAMHDQLTGLYNRHFVAEQVTLGIAEAKRHGNEYSMMVIDVDFFKKINDEHGHDVGDRVLQEVASLLQGHVRCNDVLARMGGEEFLILMNHCNLDNANKKAQFLRAELEQSQPAGITITASFGVAQLNKFLDNFDKLFKAADEAVYQAKRLGRNRVELAAPP